MNASMLPRCTHVFCRDEYGRPLQRCGDPAAYVPYYPSGRLATYYARCRAHACPADRPIFGWGRGVSVEKLTRHNLCEARRMPQELSDHGA